MQNHECNCALQVFESALLLERKKVFSLWHTQKKRTSLSPDLSSKRIQFNCWSLRAFLSSWTLLHYPNKRITHIQKTSLRKSSNNLPFNSHSWNFAKKHTLTAPLVHVMFGHQMILDLHFGANNSPPRLCIKWAAQISHFREVNKLWFVICALFISKVVEKERTAVTSL